MIRNFLETEFILIHNSPTRKEIKIINSFKDKLKNNLINLIIPEREKLYESWNRAIFFSRGKFLAIWNVDDIRFSREIVDGYYKIKNYKKRIYILYFPFLILIKHKYFNYYHITKIYIDFTYKFDQNLFQRGAFCGPFFIFDKMVINKIGFLTRDF